MSFTEKKSFYKLMFIILTIVLMLGIVISSMTGVADISIDKAVRILLSKLPLVDDLISLDDIKKNQITIIWQIRLPRIILAAFVGMGLSVSGAAFQGMFKNPMAYPYVLGISSGAALGAAIAMIFGLGIGAIGIGGVTLFAFIGAILTVSLVYLIAKTGTKIPASTLLLAGISINYLFSAAISLLMLFNHAQIEKIVFWLMGSVSAASWNQVYILVPIVVLGTIGIGIFSRDLNIMLLGEDSANSLGVEVERVKKILLFISSMIVASAVSVSGIIGFVGLIVPHTIRLLIGPDNRVLIPFSAIGGAIFMILADTMARVAIPPTELPVGSITSLFGAPYFIYLLVKTKKKVA